MNTRSTPLFQTDTIPKGLRAHPFWAPGKLVWNEKRGKHDKIPINVTTGHYANANDATTFTRFASAVRYAQEHSLPIVGVLVTGGLVAIDIDDCRDPETGELSDVALDALYQLGTYCEVSPSGTGIHFFLRAGEDTILLLARGYYNRDTARGIECYWDGRYMTVTGNALNQHDVTTLPLDGFSWLLKPKPKPNGTTVPAEAIADAEERIQHALEIDPKLRALWYGEAVRDYPSPSEADSALCAKLAFYLGRDVDAVERAFRASPLGQRAKVQERTDYARRTAEHACALVQDVWKPIGDGKPKGTRRKTATRTATNAGDTPPPATLAITSDSGGDGQAGAPAVVEAEDPRMPEPEKIYRHLLHLRQIFAGRFRWVSEWQCWLKWTGTHWARVDTEEVESTALEELRALYAGRIARGEDAEKWAKRVIDLTTTRHLRDAIELLRGYSGFLTHSRELDADPYLLNTPTGTLNLRTGTVYPHDPADLCTRITNGRYDPTARCERFLRFLEEIFGGNAELIRFVQRASGLSLIGENRHHLLFVCYGTGANGKSTLLQTMRYVVGGYGGSIPRDAVLTAKYRQDAQRTAYAALEGVRLATLEELAEDTRLSITAIKDLTSNNYMQARALYQNYREIQLGLTPFIACNTKPRIEEHTEATWRRLRLIPFEVTIPPDARDAELVRKLAEEADGILTWMVDGLMDYWRNGLCEPRAVLDATREYRNEQDVLAEFLDTCCELSPRWTERQDALYNAYTLWAQEQGETEDTMLTALQFGRRLTKYGFKRMKGSDNAWRRVGIRLRNNRETAQEGA